MLADFEVMFVTGLDCMQTSSASGPFFYKAILFWSSVQFSIVLLVDIRPSSRKPCPDWSVYCSKVYMNGALVPGPSLDQRILQKEFQILNCITKGQVSTLHQDHFHVMDFQPRPFACRDLSPSLQSFCSFIYRRWRVIQPSEAEAEEHESEHCHLYFWETLLL